MGGQIAARAPAFHANISVARAVPHRDDVLQPASRDLSVTRSTKKSRYLAGIRYWNARKGPETDPQISKTAGNFPGVAK